MATPRATTPREAGRRWANSGFFKTPGIPDPSGPHNVGVVEVVTETGLLVKLFYPTQAQDGHYMSPQHDERYVKALCEINKIKPVWLITKFFCKLTDPKSPALVEAPIKTPDRDDSEMRKYPVIVFSHGLHAHGSIYSCVCCDLASHGYIVTALDHKDQSACVTFNRVPGPGVAEGDYDNYINEWIPALIRPFETLPLRNDQVKQRSREAGQCLDLLNSLNNGEDVKNLMGGTFDLSQFKGRMDIDRAAVMGHSFGGATTINTLASDDRFKCGIALDAWMYPLDDELYQTGINQPLLFINTFSFQWPENVAKMMKLVTKPNETGIAKCSLVTLKGTNHESQCDVSFIVPSFANKYSTPNAYEAMAANSELCVSFYKRYLLEDSAFQDYQEILDGGENVSHDVVLYGTNVDWEKEELANNVDS